MISTSTCFVTQREAVKLQVLQFCSVEAVPASGTGGSTTKDQESRGRSNLSQDPGSEKKNCILDGKSNTSFTSQCLSKSSSHAETVKYWLVFENINLLLKQATGTLGGEFSPTSWLCDEE